MPQAFTLLCLRFTVEETLSCCSSFVTACSLRSPDKDRRVPEVVFGKCEGVTHNRYSPEARAGKEPTTVTPQTWKIICQGLAITGSPTKCCSKDGSHGKSLNSSVASLLISISIIGQVHIEVHGSTHCGLRHDRKSPWKIECFFHAITILVFGKNPSMSNARPKVITCCS